MVRVSVLTSVTVSATCLWLGACGTPGEVGFDAGVLPDGAADGHSTVDDDAAPPETDGGGPDTSPRDGSVPLDAGPPIECSDDCRYVRADAPAPGDGADWSSAWPVLPDTLVRGHTYFVADGDYPGYVFGTPGEGATAIRIVRAIAADHGTDTGWEDAYGDGVAVFGPSRFTSSHWIVDGRLGGGPGSWTTGHGFRFARTDPGPLVRLEIEGHHVALRHVELQHRGLDTETSDDGMYCPSAPSDFTLQYSYLHDFGRVAILTRGASGWLIENSYIARNSSSASQHSEAWSDMNSNDMIVRNNIFADIEGTAVIAFLGHEAGTVRNWQIYGNVFVRSEGNPYDRGGPSNGVVATNSRGTAIDVKFHHNTMVNLEGLNAGLSFSNGTGNEAFNNLWYGCTSNAIAFGSVTHDYSWFYGNARNIDGSLVNRDAMYADTEAHAQIGEADPFVDWGAGDFRLRGPTEPGGVLEAPFDRDLLGQTRGHDGHWDRGAIEH